MKFRKKPIVIEAVQFSNKLTEMGNKQKMLDLFGDFKDWRIVQEKGWETILFIQTLEGEMSAKEGDWIIKGVSSKQGVHFWPVKPDYFEENYEAIKD